MPHDRGTLIDANLLCLMVVGQVDVALIPAHPRLRIFDVDDFAIVDRVLNRVGAPVLCPHVLAETSNLLGFRQTAAQQQRWLASLAAIVERCTEVTETALEAVTDPAYTRLGMTDAILMILANGQNLSIISDDLQLCLTAERRGLRAINYNYLREGTVRVDQI